MAVSQTEENYPEKAVLYVSDALGYLQQELPASARLR